MAYLVIYHDGEVALRCQLSRPTLIGRSDVCDIILNDPSVSRRHCYIEPTTRGWQIMDLGSFNKSLVGGVPVDELPLLDGDRLQLGATQLRFYEGSPLGARPATPEDALADHRLANVDQNVDTLPVGGKMTDRPMPTPQPVRVR